MNNDFLTAPISSLIGTSLHELTQEQLLQFHVTLRQRRMQINQLRSAIQSEVEMDPLLTNLAKVKTPRKTKAAKPVNLDAALEGF